MTKPKRIFVVGHTGAGKFLLSEALAKRLGWGSNCLGSTKEITGFDFEPC